ncbi:MAG: cation:proton antiporter [Deltaproteobacteria bacterium]|nr:cation:proton antiporter [Deltaproteobacteria bacterium]
MTLYLVWFGLLTLGVALSLLRALRGPSVVDRVVAVDVVTTTVSAFMIILAAQVDNVLLLDVSLVYGVLSFLAVLYVGRHLEEGF